MDNITYDALYDILMRLDPCNILNCIVVSKFWLSVITSSDFQTNHLKTWKENSSSKVVGFFRTQKKADSGLVEFLPTSKIGLNIKRSYSPEKCIELFLSKSPTGNLLLSDHGIDPNITKSQKVLRDNIRRGSWLPRITYGVDPRGDLLAAICSYPNVWFVLSEDARWYLEYNTLKIYAFDHGEDGWHLLHVVKQDILWAKSRKLLMSVHGTWNPLVSEEVGSFKVRYEFVSFVPGRSNSAFITLYRHLFVYDFRNEEMEYVEYLKDSLPVRGDDNGYGANFIYHPLTMLDLRTSAPPFMHLPYYS